MKRKKFATGEQIKVITTGGLRGYPRMLKKGFVRRGYLFE